MYLKVVYESEFRIFCNIPSKFSSFHYTLQLSNFDSHNYKP